MSASTVTSRTYATAAVGFAAVAAVYVVVKYSLGGETFALAVSDFGAAAFSLAAAILALRVAFSFGSGGGLRRQWTLIGIGLAFWAAGDIAWAVIEVILERDPFPSIADYLYAIEYLFLAAGILLAGLAYRHLVSPAMPAVAAGIVGVAGLVAIYALILQPYILQDTEYGAAAKFFSGFYPVADVVFGLVPAVFTLLMIARLGGGRFAWPWWAVAAGMVCVALGDAGFAYLDWSGLYEAGSIVDYAWLVSLVLIAVGASLQRDVSRPVGA